MSGKKQTSKEALPLVLTPSEAAALLRISARTLAELTRAQEIPGAKQVGGSWRYSRQELLEWVAKGERT